MTKKYGILAFPAKHSLSPVMHNAAFKAAGIDAQYGVFEVPETELDEFLDVARHEPISGLSVSLPYKEDILDRLDFVDKDATAIEAVNTIVNRGGFLYGHNTDFIGAVRALEEAVGDLNQKLVVLLGAGGSAKAIAYGLLQKGAHIWIQNRTGAKAAAIALQFAENFQSEIHSDDWGSVHTADIVINTTSMWLKNPDMDETSLPHFCDPEFLAEFEVAMDISYNNGMKNYPDPLRTPLIQSAEEVGIKTITGDKMLLYQAAEQFKLWTDEEAPIEVMWEALVKNL